MASALDDTSVTDNGLPALLPLKLRHLRINGCAVTDRSTETLAQMTLLWGLEMAHTKVGDAGLATLAGLKNIEWIDLQWTNVTDAGLVHLSRLPKLTWVCLFGDHITDAGLAELQRLTKLQQLEVGETDGTSEGYKRLAKALPKTIVRGGHRRPNPFPRD